MAWAVLFLFVLGTNAGHAAQYVILELDTPPAAVVEAEMMDAKAPASTRKQATQARVREIEAAQARMLTELRAKSAGTTVLYTAQRVYNGIAVRVDTLDAEALRSLPGVKAVHPLETVHLHLSSVIPFLGIPEIWDPLAEGLTGSGIRIGVIDTGLDYLHPDFGGSGEPADYAANNLSQLGDANFPNAKVAGGFDFVGDNYNPANEATRMPVPDPDPFDQNGHGTHVSGIASGLGVTAVGNTYGGPYTRTLNIQAPGIAPGVAPEATLYALKIFGGQGASEVLIPAIEWAVDPDGDGDLSDHLDVLNMSLGSEFGFADSPDSIAANNAAAAGIIVVASAGNSGDSYYVAGAPGAAPRVISVAASEDDDPNVSSDFPDRLTGFSSRGPSPASDGTLWLKPDIAAPGNRVTSAGALINTNTFLASTRSGTSMASPLVAGAMALLRQRYPDETVAALKALAMNGAFPDLRQSVNPTPLQIPGRAGGGRLNLARTLSLTARAHNTNQPEAVSLTFQTREAAADFTETIPITLEQLAATSASYDVRVIPILDLKGLTFSISADAVGPVAPGASAEVQLTLSCDVSALKHTRDPAALALANGLLPHWLAEASGHVVFAPRDDSPEIRVPYYAAVRPVSERRAAFAPDTRFNNNVSLVNSGTAINTGNDYPRDITSLFSTLELMHKDAVNPAIPDVDRAADVAFVGVWSDVLFRDKFDETMIYFGLASHAEWTTPHMVRSVINVDNNADGVPDFVVFNDRVRGGTNFPDVFATYVADYEADDVGAILQFYVNDLAASDYDTALFNSNVMVLPVKAAQLGLTESASAFHFTVETYTLETLEGFDPHAPSDVVPGGDAYFVYDAKRPSLNFAHNPGMVTSFDRPQTNVTVTFDEGPYRAYGLASTGESPRGVLGILSLHHHNAMALRAEWVPIVTAGDTDGDGITDGDDGTDDPDGDGIPNLADDDSDGDTLPDSLEGTGDPDGDMIPNFLDLDSDNDTLSDEEEVNLYGSNPLSADTDRDGRDDATEVANGTDPTVPQAPEAPANLDAEDGMSLEAVQVTWGTLPGDVRYRLYGGATENFSDAGPLTGWIKANSFVDATAPEAAITPGRGCQPDMATAVFRYYWVQARIETAENPPELAGPLTGPEIGYRAVPESE